MPLDFSDLIPAKPQASGISFDDLIPKQQADAAPTPAAATMPEPDASQRVGAAAVKGAVEGFGHPIGQTILSPEAQEWMDAKQREGGVGGFLAGLGSTAAEDIGTVGGVLAGIPNAVFRGAQGVVAQTGAELGAPQLGRDIAAIPEAFMGSPNMLSKGRELSSGVLPTDRPYIPRSAAEGNLLLDFPRSPDLTVTARQIQARDGVGIMEAWSRAHAENNAAAIAKIGQATDIDGAIAAAGRAAEAPGGGATAAAIADTIPQAATGEGDLFAPQPGPPVPQSAGAAASRDMTNPGLADISTSDMKANRRVAEQEEVLRPPQANDTMIYVPGSFPTLAERSGDPVLSQYENLLRQRKPEQFIGEGKRLTENNKARVAEFDTNTVPDTTLNSMRRDRDARFSAASDDILPTAKPADLTPAMDWVQEQLSNPRIQENDAVRSVLESFQDRIVDDAGNLKTDPAAVWGMHDHLQNLLAKAKDPLNATGAEKFAQSQILKMKQLIDQAMNVATDNRFQSALDRYAEDSKAINSGMLFNDFRPKLTNMSGEVQAANFHNFVKGLAKERGDPGIDPSMDISDAGMRSMINIDADLKRAGLIKLGAAAGSPTNLLGALAERAGLNAAHAIVGKIPAVGGLLSEGAKYFSDRKLIADAAKHLAPPEGGYTYPEPDLGQRFSP